MSNTMRKDEKFDNLFDLELEKHSPFSYVEVVALQLAKQCLAEYVQMTCKPDSLPNFSWLEESLKKFHVNTEYQDYYSRTIKNIDDI